MGEKVLSFYEDLADHYHLIFADWDCACGIGTQAIGLAAIGHQIVGSDICQAAIERARTEARRRSLNISFRVSDMTSLREIPERDFDVVVAMDNALPYLSPVEIAQVVASIACRLRPGGLFLASIRDYDTLIQERPLIQQPVFHGELGNRCISHQVWDWVVEDRYIVHLFITTESSSEWNVRHFVSEYRCLPRAELTDQLAKAGFEEIEWRMPEESSFYQPLVIAKRIGSEPGTLLLM
jgi:SAM-dependent methyltransferase